MTTHSITPYDLEEIGRNGYGSINCKILGYWSSNPITLYINRQGWSGAAPQWNVTMSHSSGGREPKEVESDMEAAINFADAMRELAIIGRDLLLTYGDTLESFYQQQCEVYRIQREAERDAFAAKFAADPAMGVQHATDIVEHMAARRMPSDMTFYERGSDVRAVIVQVVIREKTRFFVNKQSVSKKAVIELLATLSAR